MNNHELVDIACKPSSNFFTLRFNPFVKCLFFLLRYPHIKEVNMSSWYKTKDVNKDIFFKFINTVNILIN